MYCNFLNYKIWLYFIKKLTKFTIFNDEILTQIKKTIFLLKIKPVDKTFYHYR